MMKISKFIRLISTLLLIMAPVIIIAVSGVVSLLERPVYAHASLTIANINATSPIATPIAPLTLTAKVMTGTQIDLSWTAATDNMEVSGYRLYRREVGQADYTPIVTTAAGQLNYSDIDVLVDHTYEYAVSAYDAEDNESELSQMITIGCKPGGKTVWAASVSTADVQAAIDAAEEGDTVIVPKGTTTWTTLDARKPAIQIGKQLTWGPDATFESKQITLQGAGIDQTIITDETHHNYYENAMLIFTVPGKPVRITGFTFRFGSDEKESKGTINISGTGKGWRIDHIKFDGPWTGNGITAGYPETYGVVDHCIFTTSATQGNFKALQLEGNTDASWEKHLSLGTENAIFIEDNVFEYNMDYRCLDGATGARWVFRDNVTHNNTDVGTHGYDSSARSNISNEIYDNTFIHAIDRNYYVLIPYRGGTGVVFNNTVQTTAGTWDSFIGLWYYCACPGSSTCGHEICTSYPCKDQPGRAPDSDHDGIQDLEPIYEWNNATNINPHISLAANMCSEMDDFIQENRDYYNDTFRPRYVPYPYPHPLTYGKLTGKSLELTTVFESSSLKLLWNPVDGADRYQVLRNWQEVTPDAPTLTWTENIPEADSVYMVYALDENGKILATEGQLVEPQEQALTLNGMSGDRKIYLTWTLNNTLPFSGTWHIDYYTTTTTTLFTITLQESTLRSTTLTDHIYNYQSYTVTLNALLDETIWLSDTVQVMPTDKLCYLPLILNKIEEVISR